VAKRFFHEFAYVQVMAGATGFKVDWAGKGTPRVRVSERHKTYLILRVDFAQRLYSGKTATYKLTFYLKDPGGAATRDLRVGDSLVSFPVWAFATKGTPGGTVTVVFPTGYDVKVEAHNSIGYSAPLQTATPAQPDHVTITLVPSKTIVTVPGSLTLSGQVLLTGKPTGAAYPVTVYQVIGTGAPTIAAVQQTDTSGAFQILLNPTANATYVATTQEPNDGPKAASGPVVVQVRAKAAISQTKFNQKTHTLTVKGSISPGPSTVTIQLYKNGKKAGSAYKAKVARAIGGATFSFSKAFPALKPGAYVVHVTVAKSATFLAPQTFSKSGFTVKVPAPTT